MRIYYYREYILIVAWPLRCSEYAVQALNAGFELRDVECVSLRRSTYASMAAVLEAHLQHLHAQSVRIAASAAAAASASDGAALCTPLESSGRGSALQTLLNIRSSVDGAALWAAADEASAPPADEVAMMMVMSQQSIVQWIDFAAATWRDDPDEVCRTIKQHLLQLAISSVTSSSNSGSSSI